MGQQLTAARLRLDNLLIKQSSFDHTEPCVNRTKGAVPPTCEDRMVCENSRGLGWAARAVGGDAICGNGRHFS
jgi:hypothetical protein